MKIYDEYEEKWFSDLETPFTISKVTKSGKRISFVKTFAGAAFSLTVTLVLDRDAFHWEVAAEKTSPSLADRSLRVYFLWPLISGWDFWAPAYDAE